ncbi:aminopeptidase M1-like protein isoform X1 [Tanacetum coccineum]
MVAVPDFLGGAMENYGFIAYREAELLHDDLHSAAANKRLSIVVAHEVGHQWFGNLVTLEWWTHLWLNEGFTTWEPIASFRNEITVDVFSQQSMERENSNNINKGNNNEDGEWRTVTNRKKKSTKQQTIS